MWTEEKINNFLANDLVRLDRHVTRKRAARELLKTLVETEEQHNAACAIQAIFRGYWQRRGGEVKGGWFSFIW